MTDAELVAAIKRFQSEIELTANHRYRVRINGAWQWAEGTTTVIKNLSKGDALVDWAARLAAASGDPRAHTKVRDDASDKGTNLHAIFEREGRLMRGEPVGPMPPATEDELMALARGQKWARESEFRPLAEEFRVYHVGLNYAGTVDMLGYVRGQLVVLDWKTAAKPYPEHYLQSAAYRTALAVMVGIDPPAGHIVRFPRDGDTYSEWPVKVALDDTQRAFEALLYLHKWQRMVKKGEAA